VWTQLQSGVAPIAGEKAEMRFTAPVGTTIAAVTIKRDLGLRSDGYYVYGRTNYSELETCSRPGGEWGCGVGGYGAGYTAFTGLNASYVAWGFECGANTFPSCTTGSTLHQAWAHLYAATVTLTDNQAPTGVSAGGSVTTGGWKGGTVAGTISGSDNLGIRNVRWYADDVLVSTSADRACDYSTTVPCSDASNVSYALDTTGLADGTRQIRAAVVDPAGNEATGAAFDVLVDNTAPAAPSGLSVTGGGSSTAISMAFSAPAADGGAPYTGSRWQACSGGTCSSGSGTTSGASGNLPNATGSYTVKVWLVDEAGNASAANSASATVRYVAPVGAGGGGGGGGGGAGGGGGKGPATTPAAPSDPGTPPEAPTRAQPVGADPPAPAATPRADAAVRLATSALDRRTGRLTVRGFVARSASGMVTITVTAKGQHTTRKTRIRNGRYVTHLRLARGTKRARVTVRYGGSATIKPGRTTRTVTAG